MNFLKEIVFDITSMDNAYAYVLDYTGMTPEELISTYLIEADRDFDLFWSSYKDRFAKRDVKKIYISGYHVLGSLDDCKEIKKLGIRNLQYVLSHNTVFSRLLKKCNASVDVEKKLLYLGNQEFNIDYYSYSDIGYRDGMAGKLKAIGQRVYYDFCVDAFLCSGNPKDYGTDIHKIPEFLKNLAEFDSVFEELDKFWQKNSTSYKVYFCVPVEQMHKFTFDIDEDNLPYSDKELDILKEKFLALALDVAYEGVRDRYFYLRDDEYIHPDQITRCEEF